MSEQYGLFAESIARLDDVLSDVRTVWKDQTALTYDVFNENMQHFTKEIWAHHNNSEEGYSLVRANYNESDFDDILNQLSAKISAV